MYFSSSHLAPQLKNASSSVPSSTVLPKNSWIALRRASAWGSVPLYFARASTYAFHAGVVPSYTAQASKYLGELYPDSAPMRSAMTRSKLREDSAWPIGIEEPSGTSSAPSSCVQSSTSAACSCSADDIVDESAGERWRTLTKVGGLWQSESWEAVMTAYRLPIIY